METLDTLTTTFVGQEYRYVKSTGSTNDDLRTLSKQEQLPDGTVLLAGHQTAGKGRLGRKWEAPPETSLLFSVLLHSDWAAERAGWMTMLAATAVIQAITTITNLKTAIKWPNDIMLFHDGLWRKTGGLLLEGDVQNGRLQQAIIGIGINVNMTAAQLPPAVTPPTSLSLAWGGWVPRLMLLNSLLIALERGCLSARDGQSPQPAWEKKLITIGQEVTATAVSGKIIIGTAESTDKYGRLLIRDNINTLHPISAADVTLQASRQQADRYTHPPARPSARLHT